MKLLIFHTEFAYSGGAERMIFREMDYLKQKGIEVISAAAFVDRDNCYPEIINRYEIQQILPVWLNSYLSHDKLIILSVILFPLLALKYRSYDCYFGANQVGPWWAGMAACINKKKYITYQNYPTTITYPRKIDIGVHRNSSLVDHLLTFFRPLIVRFDKLVIKKAYVSFADGEYVANICKKVYGREFINCPGGTDSHEFNKSIWQRRIKNPYILVTNRNVEAKRIDYAIDILKFIHDKRDKKIRLIITGSHTTYTDKLVEIVKAKKLERFVEFAGLVDEDKLQKFYSGALVYLYTASEEDFGLGILEANSYGVPVVVWDNAGPKYLVVNGKNGYKCKLSDLKDYKAKTLLLCSDLDLNLSLSQKAHTISRDYLWQNHGKILYSKIKNV